MIHQIVGTILKHSPGIKHSLVMARMDVEPEKFVEKCVMTGLVIALGLTVFLFFLFAKLGIDIILLIPIAVVLFFGAMIFMLKSPGAVISRRRKEIESEVLFLGRYLLVKIDSGVPLYNAMIDASKSFGIGGKYMKEIVEDINLGVPLEDALDQAREYTPSPKFKWILSELIVSLKTGIDISDSLRAVLDQITREQLIEIKEYSRKLNALMMLYMVIATVLPSLGMTLLVVVFAFLSIDLTNTTIFIIIFALICLQFMFLAIIRSTRPNLNI
ncbi:type II secretion system F family protein [Candidatus Woesearchaeota archaeon]|nr:type II secretion system F family protein [Candidatus Woesearchaeota archaeon]